MYIKLRYYIYLASLVLESLSYRCSYELPKSINFYAYNQISGQEEQHCSIGLANSLCVGCCIPLAVDQMKLKT